MLTKRVIVCLDVRAGKTTKGVRFEGNVDVGDPVEMAGRYYDTGVDELVFYDITASHEKRGIMIEVVRRVAEQIFIPFCVGGGLRTVADMREVLLAGADKVSIDSGAVRSPKLITEGARAFGSQCIVLGMQARHVGTREGIPSGYEIFIDGARVATGLDALEWAGRGEELGAGEICLNSIDADGTKDGYELAITKMVSDAVGIPVIASGGAGTAQHMVDVVTQANADAALIASMVHFGEYEIPQIKEYMKKKGVAVREKW